MSWWVGFGRPNVRATKGDEKPAGRKDAANEMELDGGFSTERLQLAPLAICGDSPHHVGTLVPLVRPSATRPATKIPQCTSVRTKAGGSRESGRGRREADQGYPALSNLAQPLVLPCSSLANILPWLDSRARSSFHEIRIRLADLACRQTTLFAAVDRRSPERSCSIGVHLFIGSSAAIISFFSPVIEA